MSSNGDTRCIDTSLIDDTRCIDTRLIDTRIVDTWFDESTYIHPQLHLLTPSIPHRYHIQVPHIYEQYLCVRLAVLCLDTMA